MILMFSFWTKKNLICSIPYYLKFLQNLDKSALANQQFKKSILSNFLYCFNLNTLQ